MNFLLFSLPNHFVITYNIRKEIFFSTSQKGDGNGESSLYTVSKNLDYFIGSHEFHSLTLVKLFSIAYS